MQPNEKSTIPRSTTASDLGVLLAPGRTTHPEVALQQAVDAEERGLGRAFVSERFDLKEAGSLLGGVGALTSRLHFGTAALAVGSRHPLVTAAMGATMRSIYGPRFILGLGRSDAGHLKDQGMREASYQDLEEYARMIRQLWAGDTVTYDGPMGDFGTMRMADTPAEPHPQIWSVMLGGPKACRTAARFADGVVLTPFLTPEAVGRAVGWIRDERERLDLDPDGIEICHPLVSTPEFDETETLDRTAARFVTYTCAVKNGERAYTELNGFDRDVVRKIAQHPMFRQGDQSVTADRRFHREDLHEPARMVPQSWMKATCAMGSIAECMQTMDSFREAGATQLAFYGSTPKENARLIEAWQSRTAAVPVGGQT